MIEVVLFWTSVYVGIGAVVIMFFTALYREVKQIVIHAWRIHDEELEAEKNRAQGR